MNLRHEIQQLKSGPTHLRKFGLTIGSILLVLTLWFAWRQKPWSIWLLIPAAALIVLGWLLPRSLLRVYQLWMGLALILGRIMSSVILTLFFYLVVTPMALLARCLGKDFLNRKWDSQAQSYWILRDRSATRDKNRYEQQF